MPDFGTVCRSARNARSLKAAIELFVAKNKHEMFMSEVIKLNYVMEVLADVEKRNGDKGIYEVMKVNG